MTNKTRTLKWIGEQIGIIEIELAQCPIDSQKELVNLSRLDALIRVASQLRINPDAEQWLLDQMGRTDQIVRKLGSTSNGAWNASLDALVDAYNVYKDLEVA